VAKGLIIVESPAKARTIEKFLGRKYTVKASMGHVRDLPRSQLGVDVENGFSPRYITIRGKGDVLKELRKAVRKSDRVLIATDPDREGEAISWHLAQALALDGRAPVRIEFHEVTKEAVREALKHPRPIDDRLVDAQQARRVLDRLVGYKLSPLLWRKVRRGLSAGRVQSVALRLIVDREREIEAFVPEEYWTLTAHLTPRGREATFQARYVGQDGARDASLSREAEVKALLEELEGQVWRVKSVRRRERRRAAPAPFTTSTLQQEASRKLGFSVRKTMAVAQQLYEGLDLGTEGPVGLVTYIRTDSTRVAGQARQEALGFVGERFGGDFRANGAPPPDEKKAPGAQGAHEAIRPTTVRREPASIGPYLTADQYRLYELIWARFVASQMAPAVYDVVTVEVAAGDLLFRATGSTVRFPGFLAVYEEAREDNGPADEEASLPEVSDGETLRLVSLEPRQHFTQPSPRYTEASLVRTLEEKGIGRPSTYVPIIETILTRGYVERDGRRLVPTRLGRVVVDLLAEYFPRVVDVEFTADLEALLDRVGAGRIDWRQVVAGFYGPFEEDLEEAEAAIGPLEVPEEEVDIACERCGRKMVVRHGRFGRFLACPGFPECKNTKPYQEVLDVPCPECGATLAGRRTRKGRRFFGCSRYPECRFMTWQRPTDRRCPDCGAFLVQRRPKGGGPVLACVREACGYQESGEAEREYAVLSGLDGGG